MKKLDMLIGLNYYYTSITGESRGKQSEPIALKSIFGWIICGYFKNINITNMYRVNTNVLNNYQDGIKMFQNILSNKCTEVEEFHKTNVLTDFEKS